MQDYKDPACNMETHTTGACIYSRLFIKTWGSVYARVTAIDFTAINPRSVSLIGQTL
jgi:hypothetical protein